MLDAAKRHFAANGFRGTRLDAIAADAGCAKGALYLEFPDKQSLLREVVDEAMRAVRVRFEADVAALPSPLARLVATLRFAYEMIEAEPLFARLLRGDPDLALLRPTPEQAAQLPAVRAELDRISGWVDEGIAKGELRPDLDRDALPFILGFLRHAPIHLAISAGLIPTDRVLTALLDVFAAGLAPNPSRSP